MNTCHICNKAASNFPIRLLQFRFDEKAVYIESILDVMLESRFGPAYSYAYLDRPDRFSADEPFSFLDQVEGECAAWYAAASSRVRKLLRLLCELGELCVRKEVSRKGREERKETRKEFQGRLAALASNFTLSNLARGSPQIPGTHLLAFPLRP